MAEKPSVEDEMANNLSSSTQSDENNVSKPFKKAKYAWQIKGKGRLKGPSSHRTDNDDCEEQGNSKRINKRGPTTNDGLSREKSDLVPPASSTKPVQSPVSNSSSTFSSLEQMILLKEKEIETDFRNCAESAKLSPENENENHRQSSGQSRTTNNVVFPSEMAAQCVEQFLNTLNQTNYNLRKWQTKQVAKTIIDNAINKVLEDMGFILPADAFDFHLSSSDSDISPQNIENEGVSEAIRQQGLQQRGYGDTWVPTASEPQGVDVNVGDENIIEKQASSTTCTCWLHWKPTTGMNQRNERRTECLLMTPSMDQDSVLDAAVSFAISEKGLGVLADQDL